MYAVAPDMVERYETVGGVAVSGGSVTAPSQPPQGDRGWNRFLIGPTRAELNRQWDALDPAMKTGPQAFLVGRKDEGAIFTPHYHPVNQFQVVLDGGGRIGKHPLAPGSFHYADANTPYGPIVTGPDGLEFMTVREQLTNVSVHMPGGRVGAAPAGRNIVAHVQSTSTDGSAGPMPLELEEVVPTQSDGLCVLAARVRRGGAYVDDNRARACRQFVLVLSGSVTHTDTTFGKSSVFFTEPGEVLGSLTAAGGDATLLVLRFPDRNA